MEPRKRNWPRQLLEPMNVALFMGTDTKLTLYNQGCFFYQERIVFLFPVLIGGEGIGNPEGGFWLFQSYLSPCLKTFSLKETSMTPKGDTHEHENKKVFSYQKLYQKNLFLDQTFF